MLIYTLGWWMISRILDTTNGKNLAIGLLTNPDQLFPLYNKAVGKSSPSLLVKLQE